MDKGREALNELEGWLDPKKPGMGGPTNFFALYAAAEQLRALRKDVPRLETKSPLALCALWRIHAGRRPLGFLSKEIVAPKPSGNEHSIS